MENKDVQKWKEISELNESFINNTMITSSIKRAKRDHKIRIVQYFSIILIPILSFTILVNTSQKFVSAIDEIPIVNKLIDIFKYNPSIYLARNTDIYQKIDQYYETKDYSLYIESMVVDEDQIVLYYQVNTNDPDVSGGFFIPNDYWPCGANASSFQVNQLSFESIDPDEAITLDEFHFTFELNDSKGNQLYEPLEITLSNDLSKVKKADILELNKEIEFDNQKIIISKVEVYPLRTIIYTQEDKNNTMDILEVHYSLKTKDGQKINRIMNGTSGMYIDENTYAYILESPYTLDQEFDIYIDDIRWIEKDKKELIFNLDTKTFDNLPDYIQLEEANNWNLTLRVSGNYKTAYGGLNGMAASGKDMEWIVEDDYVSFCILVQYDDLEFDENNQAIIINDIGYMKEINQLIK